MKRKGMKEKRGTKENEHCYEVDIFLSDRKKKKKKEKIPLF